MIKIFISPDRNSFKNVQLRNGLKFKVRYKMEIWTLKETILDDCYLSAVPQLKESSTIVDIGAALGDFCIWAARQYPKSRLIAFEPQPDSYRLALENIKNNKITNVDIRCAGVSSFSKTEFVPIVVNARPGSFSFLDISEISKIQSSQLQKINFVALSEIIGELQFVDLLKIDCEGGEYDIILNSPQDTFNKIRFMVLEWHDNIINGKNHKNIIDRLEELGFDVQVKLNPVHSYLGFIFAKNKLIIK